MEEGRKRGSEEVKSGGGEGKGEEREEKTSGVGKEEERRYRGQRRRGVGTMRRGGEGE